MQQLSKNIIHKVYGSEKNGYIIVMAHCRFD